MQFSNGCTMASNGHTQIFIVQGFETHFHKIHPTAPTNCWYFGALMSLQVHGSVWRWSPDTKIKRALFCWEWWEKGFGLLIIELEWKLVSALWTLRTKQGCQSRTGDWQCFQMCMLFFVDISLECVHWQRNLNQLEDFFFFYGGLCCTSRCWLYILFPSFSPNSRRTPPRR